MIYYIGSANNVLSLFKRHLCSQDVFVIVIQYQYGSTLGLKSHLGRKRVCPPAIKPWLSEQGGWLSLDRCLRGTQTTF